MVVAVVGGRVVVVVGARVVVVVVGWPHVGSQKKRRPIGWRRRWIKIHGV